MMLKEHVYKLLVVCLIGIIRYLQLALHMPVNTTAVCSSEVNRPNNTITKPDAALQPVAYTAIISIDLAVEPLSQTLHVPCLTCNLNRA